MLVFLSPTPKIPIAPRLKLHYLIITLPPFTRTPIDPIYPLNSQRDIIKVPYF